VCGARWYVRQHWSCSADAGQIWDPYRRFYDSGTGSAVRNDDNSFIPFNNLAFTPVPAVRSQGSLPISNRQASRQSHRSGRAEHVEELPGTERNRPRYYNNWFGSGSRRDYNDQFDIKVDHRFNEKESGQREVFVPIQHGMGSTVSRTSPIRVREVPVGPTRTCFAINDTHTFSQACC